MNNIAATGSRTFFGQTVTIAGSDRSGGLSKGMQRKIKDACMANDVDFDRLPGWKRYDRLIQISPKEEQYFLNFVTENLGTSLAIEVANDLQMSSIQVNPFPVKALSACLHLQEVTVRRLSDHRVARSLVAAIAKLPNPVSVVLEHLDFSDDSAMAAFDALLATEGLQTLRLLMPSARDMSSKSFKGHAGKVAESLETLQIMQAHPGSLPGALLKMIGKHALPNLKRLDLRHVLPESCKEVATFISGHARTLKVLILDDCQSTLVHKVAKGVGKHVERRPLQLEFLGLPRCDGRLEIGQPSAFGSALSEFLKAQRGRLKLDLLSSRIGIGELDQEPKVVEVTRLNLQFCEFHDQGSFSRLLELLGRRNTGLSVINSHQMTVPGKAKDHETLLAFSKLPHMQAEKLWFADLNRRVVPAMVAIAQVCTKGDHDIARLVSKLWCEAEHPLEYGGADGRRLFALPTVCKAAAAAAAGATASSTVGKSAAPPSAPRGKSGGVIEELESSDERVASSASGDDAHAKDLSTLD